ncbi:MAG: spore maturation protein [Ruminococcaceae bacterium]|nr:spore maturation protein [Oscillospiraceae bacterium]
MEIFQNIILPLTVIIIIFSGLIKRLPVFSIFLQGAEKALKQTAELLPALTALTVAVTMLSSSGATDILCKLLSPLLSFLGIPEEVLPLCIIAPFSGSGSLAALEEILTVYSPDSYIGKTASVIAGASETTFYAVAVYYGSVGITKTGHTIPAALTADITSYIAAAFFCRIM